jgi:hypothetical protein
MGLGRRMLHKSVRRVTPRPLRGVTHPVRKLEHKVTPRPIRRITRAGNTITHPLGALENKAIGTVLGAGGGRRRRTGSQRRSAPAGASDGQRASRTDRAAEAADSQQQLNRLLTSGRQRFPAACQPVLIAPRPVDPGRHTKQEWARRKGEAHFWQRARRRQLRLEAAEFGQARASELDAQAQAHHRQRQARADADWQSLTTGDPAAVVAALNAGFSGTRMSVAVIRAAGSDALLVLRLPGLEMLPARKPYTTPGGRLSAKAWTKTELNELYATLLGGELLATVRKTWASGPSLQTLRIIGSRGTLSGDAEVLFDVSVERADSEAAGDGWGEATLSGARWGLNRVGRAREIRPWVSAQQRPDTATLAGIG